jgi:uncharacterized protein
MAMDQTIPETDYHVAVPQDSPVVLVAAPAAQPAAESERIVAMDVLRGVALLGILVMNIQSFAMIDAAYSNPAAYGDLTGGNFWVWYLSHVLADQKFMTIFSMLFGAGIVVMTGRAEAAAGRAAALHYRRMGVLVLFGLVHAYLCWMGDILYSYAMCGMLAYLFRKCAPWVLLLVGVLCLAVPSVISCAAGLSLPAWPADLRDEVRAMWQPNPSEVAEALAAYRGGWIDACAARLPMAFAMQTFLFVLFVFWRVFGLMLIGMALFRLGVFHAARSAKFYLAGLMLAGVVGVPIVVYGAERNLAARWAMEYSAFFGVEFNYWGSVLVSGGWIAITMLACKSLWVRPALAPLAAVGRMALTNYLSHTLICTTIFYGHGFGLYGSVERVGQLGIVVGVWALQLIVSPLWLRWYRFGPAEWLWRSCTYGRRQPMWRTDERELGVV